MSQFLKIFAIIIIITQSFSCKFDLFTEYKYNYPIVTIENIEQHNDTTFVDVKVAESEDPIELIGLSFDTDTVPDIAINQSLFQGDIGASRIYLVGLEPETDYNIVAFAGNGYSYAVSEHQSFTVPLISSTAPCELEDNHVKYKGGDYTFTSTGIRKLNDRIEIKASSSQFSMTMFFSEHPTSAIYTTTSDYYPKFREVGVEFTIGNWWVIKENSKVYITKLGDKKYNISFCALEVQTNGGVFLEGNFQVD